MKQYPTIIKILLLIALATSLASCSISMSIDINNVEYDKETFLWKFNPKTSMLFSEIDYGLAEAFSYPLVIDEDDEKFRFKLFVPKNNTLDSTRLTILIPPMRTSQYFMYGLLSESIRQGNITVILPNRGVIGGLNESLEERLGLEEINDVFKIIKASSEVLGKEIKSVSLFGASLGGVVALNAVKSDTNNIIKKIAIESPPYDIFDAAKKVMGEEEYLAKLKSSPEKIESYENISTNKILKNLTSEIPILLIYSAEDKFIPQSDFHSLEENLKASFSDLKIIKFEEGPHHFRMGFPLSEEEVLKLNKDIIDFLR